MPQDLNDVVTANQFAAVARSLGWSVLLIDTSGDTIRLTVEHAKAGTATPATA